MHSKILLVTIPENIEKGTFSLPLGILSLRKMIQKRDDYFVEVIDFGYLLYSEEFEYNGIEKDFNEYVKKMSNFLLAKDADAIGFSAMCNNIHLVLSVLERIKIKKPDIKIILGGPQPTFTARELLEQFDKIDAICIGESETTILSLLDYLIYGKDLNNLSGLCYRKETGIVYTGLPQLVDDLDTLPLIEFEEFNIQNLPTLDLDVGRGCPYSCTFCSTKVFWERHFRLKSVNRLLLEIENLLPYNIGILGFQHDMFTANRKHLFEFCNQIIQRNLNFQWVCSSRIDVLTPEIVEIMRKAGCIGIFVGIESGSQRIQKILRKNLKIPEIEEKIASILNQDISLTLSFIYDFPEETEKDLEDTLSLIFRLYQKI